MVIRPVPDAFPPEIQQEYIRDPAEIYRQSFATIGREADLARFSTVERDIAIRLIHACGMVDIADDLEISPGAVEAGRAALAHGRPVICDVHMVEQGIIRRMLPRANPVLCNIRIPEAEARATALATTRSAAAIDTLERELDGAIVAIGNAPTALFHLLQMIDHGVAPPALILGIPVGFVGAVESKRALANHALNIPYITVHGRRGGSAMASSVVNALASGLRT